jgi:hypothetical protein
MNTRTLLVKSLEEEQKQGPFRIQSLIFPKAKWDSASAVRSWLSSHEYQTELDETDSSWRARQEAPGRFETLRTICLDPGRDASGEDCRISAVGGPLKDAARASDPGERKHLSLEALINELTIQVQYFSFIQDVRARDGKSLSPETTAKVDALWHAFAELRHALKLCDPDVLAAQRAFTQATTETHDRLEAAIRAQRDAADARERAANDALIQQFQSMKAKMAAIRR